MLCHPLKRTSLEADSRSAAQQTQEYFMKYNVSLPQFKQSPTGPCQKPVEARSHFHTIVFNTYPNLNSISTPRSSQFMFLTKCLLVHNIHQPMFHNPRMLLVNKIKLNLKF